MKNIGKSAFVLFFLIISGAHAQEQLVALNTKKESQPIKSVKISCKRKNDDMTKCLSCHNKNGWKEMKYVHAPVAMNECRPCHIKAENVKTEKLATALKNIPCLFCHQASEIKEIHPDEFEKEKPDCNGCHDPHASNEKYFLR